MKRNIKILIVIPLMLFFTMYTLNAQYGSFGTTDAQTIGAGNTFGSAFGILSLGKNPALLAYPRDTVSAIHFQIPNFEFKALETSMSLDDFNNYFNYPQARNLSDKERNEFYKSFGEDNSFYFNAGSKVFAISWKPDPEIGTFAFSVTDYLAGTVKIPLTLVDLIINGNTPLKTYKFDDMEFNTWWIRTHTVSYAREIKVFDDESFIKSLTGGISLKYVSGFAYAGIEKFNADITTNKYNVLDGSVHYLARSAFSPDFGVDYSFTDGDTPDNTSYLNEPAGSGFGFDIGFAADLDYNFRIGLAFTDIGSITWDTHTAEYVADGDIHIDDLFNKDQRNDLENFLKDSSYQAGSFSTSLPTAMRLSIAHELSNTIGDIPGQLTIHLGYNQGFNKMPGNSTDPRISLGFRWQTLSYVPVVYTGFTNNRGGEINWTFGLGWHTSVLDIAFATQDVISLISNSGSPYMSFAMNCIWKISY